MFLSASAQNEILVSSKVVSSEGEPLMGVVVLEVSMLGYETISVSSKEATSGNIVLKDDITLLEEIVMRF